MRRPRVRCVTFLSFAPSAGEESVHAPSILEIIPDSKIESINFKVSEGNGICTDRDNSQRFHDMPNLRLHDSQRPSSCSANRTKWRRSRCDD